jgi:aryl-alcohol dehydrogenase-like predicted oxidoreductase
MDTRRIGALQVSIVGLGCNNFGPKLDVAATAAVVHAALDAGITFFDTADVYGTGRSEEFLAKALAGRREQVVIASKFGMEMGAGLKGASPGYVRRACEASLKRLRSDRIDLYQLHRPDPATPIADTLGALDELVRAGKVREIGCSCFTASQLRAAREAATGRHFVSVQNEYSLLAREPEREVLAECERQGLAFVPYYPLASGLLTGKYQRGQPAPAGTRLATNPGWNERFFTDPNAARAESLAAFARSRGHTLLELAVSWLLRHRIVASVIAGATSPEQVRSNAAAPRWTLSAEDLARVDAIVPRAAGGVP